MEKKGFDLKLLKDLIAIFEESSVAKMELSTKDFELKLSKYADNLQVSPVPPRVAESPPAQEPQKQEENVHYIKSPMVGTFYRAPAPGAEPFVKEGDRVRKGDVVCIIEAMKIMNEIKSDVDGVIEEVLVENAHPVEYGQPLFKVRLG